MTDLTYHPELHGAVSAAVIGPVGAPAGALDAGDWTLISTAALADHLDAPLPLAVNQNIAPIEKTGLDYHLLDQLPVEIRTAVCEWAGHLSLQGWMLRRRAIKRFAECFADQFLAQVEHMSDEEYDSLCDIGQTCLLEMLDDGAPIADMHQARCYLESVHSAHQQRARAFIAATGPQPIGLH